MNWHLATGLLLSTIFQTAYAQDIRSCVSADGSVMYTDKECSASETEKAKPQAEQPAMQGKALIALPPGCDRTPDDLLYGVRSAIDSKDVNQLAKHYHWLGVSDVQAESIMDRLEALLQKPLVDAQLIYPSPAISAYTDTSEFPDVNYQSTETTMPSKLGLPYGLKILQYQTNTSSEIQSSQFKLQRYFECWWIRY